jgi:hypothetical protein
MTPLQEHQQIIRDKKLQMKEGWAAGAINVLVVSGPIHQY